MAVTSDINYYNGNNKKCADRFMDSVSVAATDVQQVVYNMHRQAHSSQVTTDTGKLCYDQSNEIKASQQMMRGAHVQY